MQLAHARSDRRRPKPLCRARATADRIRSDARTAIDQELRRARAELLAPKTQFLDGSAYNRVLTLHGVIMTFLFIIPSIPAIFGNFVLPIQIGANDVSFPRLNLASWYFYMAGAVLALCSVAIGGVDTGWTFYVPYSGNTDANVHSAITSCSSGTFAFAETPISNGWRIRY